MIEYVPQFKVIFEGNNNAHGVFEYEKHSSGDKVEGVGKTVKEEVTALLWDKHLRGVQHIGIIPINQESNCKFGVIDIDNYDIDLAQLVRKLYENKIPVIPFRSKSGGAHLYLFVKEFVPATLMQKKLREIASFLGHGSSEIFPKQSEIIAERGDVGNWINMPYFSSNDSLQYALTDEGKALTVKQFLTAYENTVVTPEELEDFHIELGSNFTDGPPCLQHLDSVGLQEGMRNSGLFNYGLYFKRKFPDNWKRKLEEYNSGLSNPLSPREILTLIKSLDSKEYQYTCKKDPICSYCNARVCRTRKYGIEVGSGFPVMGSLTKLETEPPLWFIDVEDGGRLELTTEDLQSQYKFQKKCMDTLNVMPIMPDKTVWQSMVATLLRDVHIIEIPEESTPQGQLLQHLEDFCTNRPGDDNPECLLRGLVWNYHGHHHFRLMNFMTYLDRNKFNHFRHNKIVSLLREFGCQYKTVNIKKDISRKVYRIPYFYAKQIEFDEPEIEGETDIPY